MDVAALDEALKRLEAIDEARARVVEMRFFGGMSEQQIAELLGVNVRTVQRYWRSGRQWLFCELEGKFS